MVKHLSDIVALFGIAAVSYGAWLAYPPAGFIVGGLALCGLAWTLTPEPDA